jgi:hypothetical protein
MKDIMEDVDLNKVMKVAAWGKVLSQDWKKNVDELVYVMQAGNG